MSRTEKSFAFCVIGAGLVIILLAAIGIRVVATANVAKARSIATRLQAAVVAHPNPVVTSPAATTPATSAKTPASASPAAPAAPAASPTTRAVTPASVAAAAPRATVAGSASPAATPSTTSHPTSVAPVTGTVTPVTSGATAPAKTTVPRTVPTAAEVQAAITAVHAIVPFYTPTATDIASAGNQVCTALDQGDSVAQVQAAALGMVGAASYASFIPSADTQVAIQTLVALYCPGYASRVG